MKMQKLAPAQNLKKGSTELTPEERAFLTANFKNLERADWKVLKILPVDVRTDVAKVFDRKNRIANARAEGIKKVSEIASIDSLTKLNNRKSFDEKIKEEVARAERYKIPLSLIFADIDHFKKVNDGFGHSAGDEVLKKFAAVLKKGVREIDFPARFGGDEFVVILPETDLAGAVVAAEKLRAAVENEFEKQEIKITASFGVAEKNLGENSGKLIGNADAQLYSAKNSGRNCVAAESPDETE